MDKTAIILAGGFSSRFGKDKGLLPLANKPLIKHVLDVVDSLVDEEIVVVSSKSQVEGYAKVVNANVKIVVDTLNMHSPLVGALTGFRAAMGEYALLLSCDTPFISKSVLALLFDLSPNRNAVIPRWPNGYIEPLQAVYRVKPALESAEKALASGKFSMRSMVDGLRGVRYISTLVLQQLDPNLKTFFNINTPIDLKRAERFLTRGFTNENKRTL
ncbi:MAG: molybdenum cofactor guanylyltransferase [Candidatus Bathyarchaeia archaeon]